MLKVLMILVSVSFLSVARGQDKGTELAGHVGLAIGMLDNGAGFNIGMNSNYPLSRLFSLEGQLTYSRFSVSTFISGEKETISALSLLAGGRLYLLAPGTQIRPYINLLIGGTYANEKSDTNAAMRAMDELTVGVSTGLFLQIESRLNFGMSLESPGFIILRAGYAF